MKQIKNNLDERQEQVLLKIEHNACWLAYTGLLAAIFIQSIVLDTGFEAIIGEWIVFIALCLYLVIACIRNGIWDRRLKPDNKTNLYISAGAGTFMTIVVALMVYFRFNEKPGFCLLAGLITGVSIAVMIYVALAVSAYFYRKKQAQLEKEMEDQENEE